MSRKAVSIVMLIVLLLSALPSVFAAKFNLGDTVEVFNTGASGLVVRDAPAGNIIPGKNKYDGYRGMILAGPQSASLGGVVYTWWKVRWGDDALEGWSAEGYPGGVDYLKKVSVSPSTKFSIGDFVKVSIGGYLTVRTDWPALEDKGMVYDNTVGKVEGGPFYGVPKGEAGFYYFWKVNYGSIAGWSWEGGLIKTTPSDLTIEKVEDIWVQPTPFNPGSTVTIYTRIKNIGASAAVSDQGLWIKAYFDGGLCYQEGIEGLGAGYAYTFQWGYTWPSDTNLHTVEVRVDPDNYIIESNENNNIKSRSFQATAPPPPNNPPFTPSNPSPLNHAPPPPVPITADLGWSGGDPDVDDTVTYDVYFGLSSSPPLVSSGQSATTYNLPTLSYVTTYYWKIVSRDNHGLTTNGPLWDFTTEPQPPQPKTLTVYSSPSGVSFTANGVSHTTPWSETYSQGTSVNLVMPSVYSGGDVRYYWDKWSDGVTSSSRTIVLNSDATVTGNYIGPYYELTVASSPISGIPFTINGVSKTTTYSEWLYQGYYTIEMPSTYNGYAWQRWLEDGSTNRIRDISVTTSMILTALYSGSPPNLPPTASFTYDAINPVIGQKITFDASSSSDPEGHDLLYKWNFGDGAAGSVKITYDKKVTHIYTTTGLFTVTLTVQDDALATDTEYKLVSIKKPPVLLVHGMELESDYDCVHDPIWREMAEYISGNSIGNARMITGYNLWKLQAIDDDHFSVYISDYAPSSRTDQHIRYYAHELETEIEAMKADAYVDKIYVVAHSMGGLVTRAYIENSDFADNPYGTSYDKDILKLIMLGTPNNGVDLAYLAAGLNKLNVDPIMNPFISSLKDYIGTDAAAEIAPTSQFMTSLNSGGHDPNVEYSAIAGYWVKTRWIGAVLEKMYDERQLLFPFTGDGAVDVDSALWGVDASHTYTVDLTHKELCTSSLSLDRVHWFLIWVTGDVIKGDFFTTRYCSPGEFRVYDSQGRVTGVINGQIITDIPDSYYDNETEMVIIYSPNDTYHVEIVGTSEGTYGLGIALAKLGETLTFNANDIPLRMEQTHNYTVDWESLTQGGEGVAIQVDNDGDGIVEYTFTSDSELTRNEFLIQTGQSALYTFSIVWGAETFTVSVESNSTVSNFAFSQPNKQIGFNVAGEAGTIGFCNVTIPKALLYGEPWTVLIDGAPVPATITENATHTSLYFTYTHSTHTIQILGTWVIPPPPPPTYSLTITTTVGGTTNPAPGTYTYTANSSVQVTAIPNADYAFDHWELDTVNVGSANPYTVLMNNNHTLKAVFTYSPPPPPLSASINPLSASILVGQSVTFTSTVSGGYTPYTYQWYLNSAPVSGATSNTWTFTLTTGGIYYVYLKVMDAKGNIAQSETARITVATVPVGGYSIPIQVQTKTEPVLPYIALIAILTAVFTKLRPKTKRKR